MLTIIKMIKNAVIAFITFATFAVGGALGVALLFCIFGGISGALFLLGEGEWIAVSCGVVMLLGGAFLCRHLLISNTVVETFSSEIPQVPRILENSVFSRMPEAVSSLICIVWIWAVVSGWATATICFFLWGLKIEISSYSLLWVGAVAVWPLSYTGTGIDSETYNRIPRAAWGPITLLLMASMGGVAVVSLFEWQIESAAKMFFGLMGLGLFIHIAGWLAE